MNTFQFLNNTTDSLKKDLNSVRGYLYKNYIKTVIEDTDNVNKRVMFISNRQKSNFENHMAFEMNGLIAEYNELTQFWTPVLIPSTNFNTAKLKMSTIVNLYNKNYYDIYKVYDGTIINMYYYNNKWRISTNKGYDVSDLPINDEYTYTELFNFIVSNYNFNIDNLNLNKCYTFCIKYNKIHLYDDTNLPPNYIILIQSVDKTTFEVSITDDIGLPIQELVELVPYKTLLYNNKKSVENNKYNHYGYILKSKDSTITQQYSYIYLESELMKYIRKMIYDYRFIPDTLKQKSKTEVDLVLLNIIKNILLNNNFKKLFPKYINKYEFVNKFLTSNLPTHIMLNKSILQDYCNNIQPNVLITTDNFYINDYNINETNKLSLIVYSAVIYNNIDINIEGGISVLVDLLDINHIHYYYDCLHNKI